MNAFMIFLVLYMMDTPVVHKGDGESYEARPFVAGGYDDDEAQRVIRRGRA